MPNAPMSNPARTPLFVYGTLCDPRIQQALFGRQISGDSATLSGWAVYCSDADGFLFIKPNTDGTVAGAIISLDERELEIADAWEDVPLYQREIVSVMSEAGDCEAWAYTRREAPGRLHENDSTSGHPHEEVLTMALALRAEMDTR